MQLKFLPCKREEMEALGWKSVDIVLVTGDAYVDHPSFGTALIGRWLVSHGYKVAILSQPRHHGPEDFRQFGRPLLFFGISAGNLDSVVANYTGNARVRKRDVYSPHGNPYWGKDRTKANRRRPDRACIRYANLARAAWPGVPIILGGIEASLRRFIHYDYQQERLRNSVLVDSKADLLIYGMGERAVLEVARRISSDRPLEAIPGTCERLTEKTYRKRKASVGVLELPGWQEIKEKRASFLDAELEIDASSRTSHPRILVQRQQGAMYLWQNVPAKPLSSKELDEIYELPFARAPHPDFPEVPAFDMIRHSITAVRGCCGNCSFCAIARHQGPVVVSRSPDSVLKEVEQVAKMEDFRGTITDLGGPTANLYGIRCKRIDICKRRDCLFPQICRHLEIDEDAFVTLLGKATKVRGVKHLFISSGLRMDLLIKTPGLLKKILHDHTPGVLKIAPEHTEDEVLFLMHKPGGALLERFLHIARKVSAKMKKELEISAYFITSHPGCTMHHMYGMKKKLEKLKLPVRKFQDFTPTPGTLATAMYVTGLDRYKKKPIYVAKNRRDRAAQRRVLESVMKVSKKGYHG